ncbi:MAG: hypothetical protein KGJ13_00430 [Patescibacteria group bacterium]|nr:hypothetical protein [Patescibacteria group bacterium]
MAEKEGDFDKSPEAELSEEEKERLRKEIQELGANSQKPATRGAGRGVYNAPYIPKLEKHEEAVEEADPKRELLNMEIETLEHLQSGIEYLLTSGFDGSTPLNQLSEKLEKLLNEKQEEVRRLGNP